MTDPMIPWGRIGIAFVFCLALAVAAILLVRRRLNAGPGGAPLLAGWLQSAAGSATSQPDLVGRLRLSPTSQIVVLDWEETHYLVHVSPACTVLLDRRAVVATP